MGPQLSKPWKWTTPIPFFFLVSQERELLGRITELQEEVSRRKNHIAQLDHQIHTLNENISTLTKELELKGKEVLKIRSEANQQIRYDSALGAETILDMRASWKLRDFAVSWQLCWFDFLSKNTWQEQTRVDVFLLLAFKTCSKTSCVS